MSRYSPVRYGLTTRLGNLRTLVAESPVIKSGSAALRTARTLQFRTHVNCVQVWEDSYINRARRRLAFRQ